MYVLLAALTSGEYYLCSLWLCTSECMFPLKFMFLKNKLNAKAVRKPEEKKIIVKNSLLAVVNKAS